MEYYATDGDDVIDQTKLNLGNWPYILGGKGNDTITIGIGSANGQEGNDTIIGTSQWSTAVYYSPSGINANLETGIVLDGHGFIDSLKNIHIIQGTGFNDNFVGSSDNDEFWGLGGNDTFDGGKGNDMVVYWDQKPEDYKITYDLGTDTFIAKKFANNSLVSVDTLRGIETIKFYGPNNYSKHLTKYDYVGGFNRSNDVSLPLSTGAGVTAVKVGNFNADGKTDVVFVQQVGTGKSNVPMIVLLNDGTGNLVEKTSTVFDGSVPNVNPGGGRTFVADFNNDGISDIFQEGFGDDAPPFPGGTNWLFLSSSTTGKLTDVSSTIVQSTDTNHGASVGDVNGDGYLDVLVNALGGGNKLLVNDGTGHLIDKTNWLPQLKIPGSGLPQTNTFSGMVDVNADGATDIILGRWDADSSTPQSLILLNDGLGNFARKTPATLPSSGLYKEIVLDVKAIDLNGDKYPDLTLSVTSGGDANTVTGVESPTYYKTPYIQLLVNDGLGNFKDETATRLPQSLAGNTSWYNSIVVTDFDRDGFTDILGTSAGGTPSVIFMNRGDGTFYSNWESSLSSSIVAADLNADGMMDLVGVSGSTLERSTNTLSSKHIYKANFGGDSLLGSSTDDFFYPRDGADKFDGASGTDTVIYGASSANYQLKFSNGKCIIKNISTPTNVDTLTNIEAIQFTDKTVGVETRVAPSYTDLPDSLWHFFVVAFNAAPGVEYMNQLGEAYRYGLSVEQIVDIFTTKTQFTSVYPTSLSHAEFGAALVKNVVRTSGTEAARQQARDDVKAALDIGWSVGKVVYTVFGNLANKALTDTMWGDTAKKFQNELAVSKFYTSVMGQSTTDLGTLRDVLSQVTSTTDVSSSDAIVSLVGQSLLTSTV